MKKILALMLAAILSFGLVACDTEDVTAPQDGTESTAPQGDVSSSPTDESTTGEAKGTITIGSGTQLNGDFLTGWTNITTNSWVKTLIHGYSTMALTPGSEYVVNPVVTKEMTPEEHEDGSKTYTFVIADDLTWNDGTPITADQYVFNILLKSSPEWAALDATANAGLEYVGFREFNEGETKIFSGVHLLGDYEFSITISAEELPYYYDTILVDIGPSPIHVMAPGCSIVDDGEGAYIDGEFTADVLRETILDPETGYRYNPQVTCGAYNFVSFDPSTFTAVVEANPLFKGTYDGYKPRINQIIIKYTLPATEVNELEAGSIDVINAAGGIQLIEPGLELVDKGLINYHTYDRNGYGLIRIHCDFGPTQFKAVRQAFMYILDREDFVRQYSGGYAIIVDSEYSKTQWVYQENEEYLENTLTHYTYNPDKAVEILEEDGWTLNEKGEAFVAGTDKMRYKDVDGELMPLLIKWASSGNQVSELLRVLFIPEAEKVGMIIEETVMQSVLNHASRNGIRDEDAEYHIFNMGLGFGIPHLLWTSYTLDPVYWGGNYNNNFIKDEELDRIVNEMKLTEPDDRDRFEEKWLEALVLLNDLVPNIPLYSDTYFEFYIPQLKDYHPHSTWSFANAIMRAYLEE